MRDFVTLHETRRLNEASKSKYNTVQAATDDDYYRSHQGHTLQVLADIGLSLLVIVTTLARPLVHGSIAVSTAITVRTIHRRYCFRWKGRQVL